MCDIRIFSPVLFHSSVVHCTVYSIKITFFVEQSVKVFIICICIKFSVDYSV